MSQTIKQHIESYLQEKNLAFKEAGERQYNLENCPLCGADWTHFYINQDSGCWDCKKCFQTGSWNAFRKLFGDSDLDLSAFSDVGDKKADVKPSVKEYAAIEYKVAEQYNKRLWGEDKMFLDYLLKERGLEDSIIKKFMLGSTGKSISIPIFEDGKLVNFRYRRDPRVDKAEGAGARYFSEKGAKPSLFNGDVIQPNLKQVIICEGEFDAMQLVQRGWANTVSITLGAGYFTDAWADKFANVQTVYLAYDNDEAGLTGMKKAASKIGVEKCKLVMLPRKSGRKKTDITNYFVDDKNTKTDFAELLKKARPVKTIPDDAIKHLSEFNEDLREALIKGEMKGVPTGYKELDKQMGGARKGRLVILSGLTSTGKTSFSSNLALSFAAQQFPVFYFSLEMPPIDICKKMVSIYGKVSGNEFERIKDPSAELQKVDKVLAEFKGGDVTLADGTKKVIPPLPIYLFNGFGGADFKSLEECARAAKEEFNTNIMVIDHLHYFAMGKFKTQDTSDIVRKIKALAMELDMTIFLLCHLNRDGRKQQKRGLYIPSLSDLRDSGAIEQDADQVLFVCRDSENPDKIEREKALIKIAKNRDGKAGGAVNMNFYEDFTWFEEIGGVHITNAQPSAQADSEEIVIPGTLL